MNFKDLQIGNMPNEYNTIVFNGQEIKVFKYLPIADKFDLIMVALQKSIVENVYNPLKLDAFFKLNIVYLYTDLTFDIEDRIDESGLFDILTTSGLMAAIEEGMDQVERMHLYSMLQECLEAERSYRTTAAAIVSKIINDMPKNAEATKNIVDNFDKEKFQEIMNFVDAVKKS